MTTTTQGTGTTGPQEVPAAGAGAGEPTGDGAAGDGAVSPVRRLRRVAGDAGMATAEYAIATLAAVGFAGLLVVILKGNEVKGLLTGLVRQALGG